MVVYYLVPVPPSPPVLWNHGVRWNFPIWSLNLKDLYQSIRNKDLRDPFPCGGLMPVGPSQLLLSKSADKLPCGSF